MYAKDPWCKHLLDTEFFPHGIHMSNGLLYMGNRLIVPWVSKVHELLFHLAHDVLGHFGFAKTYGSLHELFYWPNMCHDFEQAYIPACADCQQNKGNTQRPMGPLHPLLVPNQQGDSVAMDFIGPLPEDEGFNCIITFTDQLNSDLWVIPTCTDISAEELAVIFFNEWYCENGLPLEIVSDCDKLFISKFWQSLHKLTRVKLKMLMAYHPESDGTSEWSNKMINQCLQYHVKHNQMGWQWALPRIHFDIMNTINASTGLSPFKLCMGQSLHVIPPPWYVQKMIILLTSKQQMLSKDCSSMY